MISLSNRIKNIKPSVTMAISARANALVQQGEDIISLCAGEPDYDTPDEIKQAGIDAIEAGYTKYTPVDGLPELKKAIQHKFKTENQLSYTDDQIVVTSGAKQCLFNLFQVLLNQGDEVIVQAPYWVSYPDMIRYCDAIPVIAHTFIDSGFKLSPGKLESVISDKTRMLILNTPHNPTGVVYSFEELQALAEILHRYPDITVISDDIYEHVRFDEDQFYNIANVSLEMFSRTVVINGVSKGYAMTGWRTGYMAGHADIMAATKTLQSQSTSNPSAVAQMAAKKALETGTQYTKAFSQIMKERHDYLFEALGDIPGIECAPAQSTFYLFPNCNALISKLGLRDDMALADYLLEQAKVAVMPGAAFGMTGYIRIAYTLDIDKLKVVIERLKKAILPKMAIM